MYILQSTIYTNDLPKKYSHFKLNIMPILSVVLLFFFHLSLSVRFASKFMLVLNNEWIYFHMDNEVIWMTICLQRYRVNWENHQIYKNCEYFEIVFSQKKIRQTSVIHSCVFWFCLYFFNFALWICVDFYRETE